MSVGDTLLQLLFRFIVNTVYGAYHIIIIIIIITITIFDIAFMQHIYNYIPDTNHVTRIYSFEAFLYLQFVLYVMLFIMLNNSYITPVLSAVVCSPQYGCCLQFLNFVPSATVGDTNVVDEGS